MFRNPRKALHLENKSSGYTPKSAGSALMNYHLCHGGKAFPQENQFLSSEGDGKHVNFFLSPPFFSEPPPEGGLDLVTNRQGAI